MTAAPRTTNTRPPTIAVDHTTSWHAHRRWNDGRTTWINGHLRRPGTRPQPLDLGCTGDPGGDPAWTHPARAAWAAGNILTVTPYRSAPDIVALILPHPTLHHEQIREALRRHRQNRTLTAPTGHHAGPNTETDPPASQP